MRKAYLIVAVICLFLSPFVAQVQAKAESAFARAMTNPTWVVHWYEMVKPGVFGKEIDTSSLPLDFSQDWGSGEVYAGRKEHIGFKAYVDLYISTPKEFYFEIGADDGVDLYINGERVLNLWSLGRKRTDGCWYPLKSGQNKLELRFFEWVGIACVKFNIADLEAWKDQLIWEKLIDLVGNIDTLEVKQRSLQDKMGNMGEKSSTLEEKVAGLEGGIGALKGEIGAVNSALASQAIDVDSLKTLVREVTDLSSRVEELEEQQSVLSETIETLEEEKIASLREEIGTLRGEVNAVNGAIASVARNVDSLEVLATEVSDLSSKAGELEEQQIALSKDVEAFKGEGVSGLREEIGTLRGEVNAVNGAIASVARNVDSLEVLAAEVSDLSSRVGELQEQQNAISNAIETLAGEEVASLKEEIGTLKRELNAANHAVTSLATDVDSLRGLAVKVSDLSSKVGKLEEQQTSLSNEIGALEEEMAAGDSWDVHWCEMVEPGVFGREVGTSSFPLNFHYNWGYGRVYKTWDHIGFKAQAKIYIPIDSFFHFKVSSDNCFALYIDGKKVLDHWGVGEALSPGEDSDKCVIPAGWHELELFYYDWEGKAWLRFHCW